MEELKLDFLHQKMNEISISNQKLNQTKNNYSEIQCVTVDVEEIEGGQRTQLISELDPDRMSAVTKREEIKIEMEFD